MKKLLSIFLILISINIYAQKDSTNTKSESLFKFDKDRISFGGGVGGGISGGYTNINISPIIAYRFTDEFIAGPRLIYNYYAIQGIGGFSNYGYSLLARYLFKPTIFGHLEYEEVYYYFDGVTRERIPALLAGVGYYNRPITISAMYDLLWDSSRSRYYSPLRVNFGIMF